LLSSSFVAIFLALLLPRLQSFFFIPLFFLAWRTADNRCQFRSIIPASPASSRPVDNDKSLTRNSQCQRRRVHPVASRRKVNRVPYEPLLLNQDRENANCSHSLMPDIGFSSVLSGHPVNPHCCPHIRSCKHILYIKLVFTLTVIILKVLCNLPSSIPKQSLICQNFSRNLSNVTIN
jgi:hypothetical protein